LKPAVTSSSASTCSTAVCSTSTSTACSTSTCTVPSVMLTAVSHSSISAALSNGCVGPQRHGSASSVNLLQTLDRLTLSTSNCAANAATAAAAAAGSGRRLSLSAVRVNSGSQHRSQPPLLGSSSTLLVDGSGMLSAASRPCVASSAALDTVDCSRTRAVASGRSPRVRRKAGRAAGKGRDKPRAVKLSRVQIQSRAPVVDDWLKIDVSSSSSVMSAGAAVRSMADVGAGDDVSGDEDGTAAAVGGVIDVSADPLCSQRVDNSELYRELAQLTHSVGSFNKLAYPDMSGHVVTPFREAFYEKRFGTQR